METATVLECMRSKTLIGFDWLAGYIAGVTNAFILGCPQAADSGPNAVETLIKEMVRRQHATRWLPNDDELKELLFDTLRAFFWLTEEAENKIAEDIAFPQRTEKLPVGDKLSELRREAVSQQHSADVERYKLRPRNIQYLERLVESARSFDGWFHWVSSGCVEDTFFPREKSRRTGETNHFIEWIHGHGNEPGKQDNMNCWEAVFFTAYKAGLLSLARIRAIHIKATIAGRANQGYFSSLKDSLGFQTAFPYIPGVGLIPMPGDIVFFDDDEHVGLCVENGSSVKVMSHWCQPKDGFGCYDIDLFRDRFEIKFGSLPI